MPFLPGMPDSNKPLTNAPTRTSRIKRASAFVRDRLKAAFGPWSTSVRGYELADLPPPQKAKADDHDLKLLDILMRDAQEMNKHYDVRNGIFLTLNAAGISAFFVSVGKVDPLILMILSTFGFMLNKVWSNVHRMSKYLQADRQYDLRNFILSIEELRTIFQAAASIRKPDNKRPPIPAISDSLRWMAAAFMASWLFAAALALALWVTNLVG